ncbi:hypothetical protein [Halalkalicoccus sp. NIPERK01]|uniref:DUF7853 family protein n=1 Tax=Halalkalicoccus sp. NIPERK01 TaxID=3053469 RepID=UPI00256EADCE|nr:hypothetical protein [Halalkalicoccus sp. NIPERK01]MDL5363082.1 hypothetical protein [Halalkalicoccus sp. NIPERK01]
MAEAVPTDTMPPSSPNVKKSLSLSPSEQWTLHHVLLRRIDQESVNPSEEPPPIEVFRAFAALDAGDLSFTDAELEAIQSVLTDYHHDTDRWSVDRPRVELLLQHVSEARNTDRKLHLNFEAEDPSSTK